MGSKQGKSRRHQMIVDKLEVLNELKYNGTDLTDALAELATLDGLTATAAELNTLDGITATVAELNILDGVTSTAAELNILDGVTSTAAELNLNDNQVAGATIVVGAEAANVINVTIQFTDAAGADMATPVAVPWYYADDAAGLDPSTTAHDVGTSIGTDGALIESVANLSGLMISEADGDVDIDIEDAGAFTVYLVLVMPNGSLVISDAITHAV